MGMRMNTKQMLTAVFGTVAKVVFAVILIFFVYRGAIYAYDIGYKVFANEPMAAGEGREVTVSITAGKSGMEIGELLEEKGLIEDANVFFIQYILSTFKDELAPGVYTLNTSMTAEEILAAMKAPETEETSE